MQFDLGEAWSQAIAFISENIKTMLIVIVGTIAIGWVINLLVFGGIAGQSDFAQTMMSNQGNPAAVFAALGGGVLIASLVQYIISSASYFLTWRVGLTQQDAAGSIGYALGAGALWFLVFAIGFIVYLVLVGIVFGLVGVAGAASVAGPGSAAGFGLIGSLLVLLFALLSCWIIARFSVAGPAMAAAGSMNPFYGLGTSWSLTGPSQWRVFGYFLLLGIVAMVILFVVGLIFGGAMMGMMGAGAGGGSFLMMMITGVVIGVPMTMILMAIPAGVYRALVPNNVGDVFA